MVDEAERAATTAAGQRSGAERPDRSATAADAIADGHAPAHRGIGDGDDRERTRVPDSGAVSAAVRADPRSPVALRLDWRSGAWIAIGLFTGLVLLGFFRAIPAPLTRVGIGILLAFALDPLVGRLRHRFGWGRPASVAAVGGALVALLAVIVLVLGPRAVDEARQFSDDLPATVRDLYDLPLAGGWLERNDAAGRVQRWAEDLPSRIDAQEIEDVARTLVDGLVAAIVVVVVAVSVLIDGDRLVSRLKAALPARAEPTAVRVGRTFYRTIGAYFSGSLLVAAIDATFVLAVGLAFGVPLAPAAALWMLAVALIPQIGGFLGGAFLGLLAFSQGADTGLVVVGLYALWNTFENHIITPAIVGDAVDLSPPATMLAALIGGAAVGIPGALVATPLVGAVKSLYLELRWGRSQDRRKRKPPWDRFRRLRRV